MSKKSSESLLPAIIVAGLFWAIYTLYIDDFISSDLRLISSYLSENFLRLFGLTVERNGTVLFGNGMRFEVIGACSGSTILKVMLGAGLFLSLTWRGLSKQNRAVAILLSGILALLSNALRVSLLVVLSLHRGSPIGEGLLHDGIGIATFILCFLTFCLVCSRLSKSNTTQKNTYQQPSHSSLKFLTQSLLLAIILVLLYLPFIKDIVSSWIGTAWDNSNHFGFIFFLIPLVLASYQTYIYAKSHQKKNSLVLSVVLIILALLLPVISSVLDIKSISGLAIIILFTVGIYRYSDTKNTALVLPLLLLTVLGFPRIILRLENITPQGVAVTAHSLRIVIFLTVIFIQIALVKLLVRETGNELSKCKNTPNKSLLGSIALYGAILSLTLSLLLPPAIGRREAKANESINREKLNLPYLLTDGWIGRDLRVPLSDQEYFGISNIIYREYTKNSFSKSDLKDTPEPVELLITFSGGDRHKNHPPEFCQSGIGWEITSKIETETTGEFSRPVTFLDLTKDKQQKYMIYFFSKEGGSEEINYSKMMLQDITSRVSGSEPNWLVVRIFSKSKSSLLDFAGQIPFPLARTNKAKKLTH